MIAGSNLCRTADGPLGTWRAEVRTVRGLLWLAIWSDGSRRLVPDTPCDAATATQLRALADLVEAGLAEAERPAAPFQIPGN